jgi:thioredoxin-like negative regulator of GroEL
MQNSQQSNSVLDQFINGNAQKAGICQDLIEEMMASGRYEYAEDTLLGILDHIRETDSVTEKQIQTVDNIKAKPKQFRRY